MTVVLLLAGATLMVGLGVCAGWRLGWNAGRSFAESNIGQLLRELPGEVIDLRSADNPDFIESTEGWRA